MTHSLKSTSWRADEGRVVSPLAQEVPQGRSRPRRGGLVAGAGLLAVSAAAAVSLHVSAPSAPNSGTRERPADVLSVLREAQEPGDLPVGLRAGSVRADSTRFLGATALGRHYAAIDVTGTLVCLVTVPREADAMPDVACVSLDGESQGALLTIGPAPRGSVTLLRDRGSATAPWTSVSPNLAYRP